MRPLKHPTNAAQARSKPSSLLLRAGVIRTWLGIEPSYLSKIERGLEPRPSEGTTKAIAQELGEDPDALLAMAGKVSSNLQDIICKGPQLFSQLIRELKDMPDHAVLRLVREVRDGDW